MLGMQIVVGRRLVPAHPCGREHLERLGDVRLLRGQARVAGDFGFAPGIAQLAAKFRAPACA